MGFVGALMIRGALLYKMSRWDHWLAIRRMWTGVDR